MAYEPPLLFHYLAFYSRGAILVSKYANTGAIVVQKLTKAQRRAWDNNGYFVVKGAFDPDEVTLCVVPGYNP